jgi:16S rRNA (cytidine1402-2'-O)-methyltransferase
MLYLIPTPIGNLADFTYRAVEAVRSCDYLLCEDTRHSAVLLRHYELHKPLKSFHEHNEEKRQEEVIDDLKQGLTIGLLSDAGTPCIADPGFTLVQRCRRENLTVTPLPGACSPIVALIGSGLPTDQFQFAGFLPRKSGVLKERIHALLDYPGTTICFETAPRLATTLRLLGELAPTRQLTVARELTKKFEEFISGSAGLLLTHFENHPPKGEVVLLWEGCREMGTPPDPLPPAQQVALLQERFHLSATEAIKAVAALNKLPKNQLYRDLKT